MQGNRCDASEAATEMNLIEHEEDKERTLTDILKRSPAGEEVMLLPR